MSLESKHVNLLRSCSRWLRVRSESTSFKQVPGVELMRGYATDLSALADLLQTMEPRETVISLDQLFEGKKEVYNWLAQGDANHYCILHGNHWFAAVQLNGELSLEQQELAMINMVNTLNGQPITP